MEPQDDTLSQGKDPLVQSDGSATYNMPQPGRPFGRFEVGELIGKGAMGVVFRARMGGREVALKVMLANVADGRDAERFRREALLAARVSHPGIVSVLDAGKVNGVAYVAMSCVNGTPLSKLRLDRPSFLRVLLKVARALGAAHRAGVVHRDLKPSNVIVDPGTHEPVIVDFGLAFDARMDLSRLSKTGEILGTPAYMPPETIRGLARPDDPRLDVYALGLVLHSELARGYPFTAKTAAGIMEQVLKGVPPLPRSTDPRLASLAMRACSLDSRKRPPHGDAFADELETLLARGEKPPRRPLLAGVLAAAVVGLAGLGVGLYALVPAAKPPVPSLPPPPPAPAKPPPPPAPALRVMSDDVAAAVGSDVAAGFDGGGARSAEERERRNATISGLLGRAPALARVYPDDGRALVLAALAAASEPAREHSCRRDMIFALRRGPSPAWAQDLVGRFCYALGFERAAVDVGEALVRGNRAPPASRAVYLVQVYLKAAPPVADPARAEELCNLFLGQKTLEDAALYPATWMLHEHRAEARMALSDRAGTVRCFEDALRASPQGEEHAAYEAMLKHAREGGYSAADAGTGISLTFATTDFLGRVSELDRAADERSAERAAAEAFEQLAATRGLTGEQSALAWLRAARVHQRGGRAELGRACLEKAGALSLPAFDTRALVERALARALLEDGGDAARAEGLALDAAAEPGSGDARTPGERADAWVLVARARKLRGDLRGASDALKAAEALAIDRREIDALRGR